MSVCMIIVLAVFLAGCLDYKAYDLPKESSDQNLVEEIAKVEQELDLDGKAPEANVSESATEEAAPEMVVEEVVLPELTEEDLLEEELEVITVKENEAVKLNVKVIDPDQDSVTYTFGKPLNTLGEWKTNYGDAGEYPVTITATDGKLNTEKKVKIVVQRVNVPPTIAAVADITVKEGEKVTFAPKVGDPNKDKVTTTISAPLANGEFTTDHTSAGQYPIRVVASDGELETETMFTLTVEDVNELPEITGLRNELRLKEGETVTLKPEVTDLDKDKITLTISEPVGDDGEWKTGFTDHGDYEVTVTANDGKDTITKKVKIIIEDVNMPPQIVEVSLTSG